MPTGQQRVLDRIETDLEGAEPRLRAMFAIFTRLTRDEGAPQTESLRRQERRRRRRSRPDHRLTGALIAVPLVLVLVAILVFLAISSSAAHGCRRLAPGPHAAAIARTSCQSKLQSRGRS